MEIGNVISSVPNSLGFHSRSKTVASFRHGFYYVFPTVEKYSESKTDVF